MNHKTYPFFTACKRSATGGYVFSRVSLLTVGYLPWPAGGTYLGWEITTLDEWGLPTLDRGYLPWMRGPILPGGVPTLDRRYLPQMGVRGVTTLDGRYLTWTGWIGGTYTGRGIPILDRLCHWQYASCGFPQHDFLVSFRRELFVMQSLRMCCKILCQNLVVHPKCMLGGSTKFHAFHITPTHPPTPQKWQFGKFVSTIAPHPPPPENGNFSSGLDLENLKLTFGNWFPPTTPPPP